MSALLEDITSQDPARVWSSSCAIIKLRDFHQLDQLIANLPEIKRKTQNLELGGALFPNREHLNFAIRKLEYYRNQSGCLCRLYPGYLMYDPKKEEEQGNVEIIEVKYVQGNFVDAYRCRCLQCGAEYHVEEREYHYTWWGWRAS
jgi:hypothetical protein